MQQVLYHIVWPHGGDASDLSENSKRRLSCYCAGTEQVLVFDRYDDLSVKDQERMRRAYLQPDRQQSTTQSGCHSQEQAQQTGTLTGAVLIQPRS